MASIDAIDFRLGISVASFRIFVQNLFVLRLHMAPAMTQAEAQTFAQEQAQSMKQGKSAGVRKCFERDSVKYATYRESQKHLKDKE